MEKINDLVKHLRDYKLPQGYSAETSGGLFIMLDKTKYKDFMKELREEYGQDSWEVGYVTKGIKKAIIKENVDIINIT